MAASTRGSSPGQSSLGRGGGSARCRISSARVVPSKARLPVTSSYSKSPNEKMSLRAVTSRPSICSGDM
jgi:hypothetical protein